MFTNINKLKKKQLSSNKIFRHCTKYKIYEKLIQICSYNSLKMSLMTFVFILLFNVTL